MAHVDSPGSDRASSPGPAGGRDGPAKDDAALGGKGAASASASAAAPNKKRSARACLSCRARKVRCNVALHGAPCTNCRLDEVECVVKPRTRKWHLAAAMAAEAAVAQQKSLAPMLPPPQRHQLQPPPPQQTHHLQQQMPISDAFSLINDLVADGGQVLQQQQQQQHTQPSIGIDNSFRAEITASEPSFFLGPDLQLGGTGATGGVGETEDFLTSLTDDSLNSLDGRLEDRPDNDFQFSNFSLEKEQSSDIFAPPFQSALTARPGAFMLFSCFPFIEADALYRLPPEDATFLEQKGCFHIPTRTILDEFMQQYFLHIHPIFPLLNERDFWTAYSARTPGGARIPLFLMQAMLFTASPYVQLQTLRTLGFATVKQARNNFYSKAKALFDTDPYRDDIISAQGALMLTYHAPTTNASISTYWLSTAVHFARSARADTFDTFASSTGDGTPAGNAQAQRTATILKRLWWCCIMRDRIMSLGLRRPLHIGAADVDADLPGFAERDFADEVRGSLVYGPATKQILVQVAVSFSELCPVLNDALAILYPTRAGAALDNPSRSRRVAMDCLARLDRWHGKTLAKFQVPRHSNLFGGPGGGVGGIGGGAHHQHESLTLFTNMMYIYHFTAKAALCNKLIFISIADDAAAHDGDDDAGGGNEEQRRLQVQAEMDRSLRGITDGFMELESMGLVKFLTNTFVAFSAFPFIWHILDSKLLESESSSGRRGGDARRDLRVYANVMRGFRQLYESTDSVLQCIERTVNHVKLNEMLSSSHHQSSSCSSSTSPSFSESSWESLLASTGGPMTEAHEPAAAAGSSNSNSSAVGTHHRSGNAWVDLLVGKPQSYVRIALTVDLSLSRGQVPSEADFPKALQALCRSRRHDVLSAAAAVETTDLGFYECLQQAFGAGATA
ncbi:uncharacterized protein E0L32_006663 [Thyridium curvatum]|uniref:Zn(2)-C6 fungal-type domain-containing protein n=1 Tax=Thyridium curvatum TaxID=1093900 RepID=A0A507B8B7_9PEZI|nr:uncharacterized protein E0L32_006663 [Thyridium curvatum]TPX13018.1 hypothetical protein E0L32_006663 [Thyridium curvatum]